MKILEMLGMGFLALEWKLLFLKIHYWLILNRIAELKEERSNIGEGREWSRRTEIGNQLNLLIRQGHYLQDRIKELTKKEVIIQKTS